MKKTTFFIVIALLPYLTLFARHANTESCPDSVIIRLASQISADSIKNYMIRLENFVSRDALHTATTKPVAEWIRDKFQSFGYETAALDSFRFNHSGMSTWQYNVVATSTGHAEACKVYVLGAHHDAITHIRELSPGADDNASGVAGVLEIARILRLNNYEHPMTLKFITFAAEEYGKIGSLNYAYKAVRAGTNIQMMINLDQISYTATDTVSDKWYISERSYPNGTHLISLADNCREKFSIFAPYYQPGVNSDSDSFDQYGYPAIYLQEYYGPSPSPARFHPYYHTPNDVVAKYNMDYCVRIVHVALAMLLKAPETDPTTEVKAVEQTGLHLFPNPCRDFIALESPGMLTEQVTLYTPTGQVLGHLNVLPGTSRIDLRHLPGGLYYIRINNGHSTVTRKIIKI